MRVKVLEAEDADMERVFTIASLAFQRNEPLWDTFWPKHWTELGRQAGVQRMLKTKNSDPYSKYLKAFDEDTGIILGMAKWNVYEHSMPDFDNPPPPGDHWENEEETLYAGYMTTLFLKERLAAIKECDGNLLSLDILAIDPAFQRLGVGDALVKWGTAKADEMGAEAVVESSVVGKGLYEKNGFAFMKDVELSVAERWMDRPKNRFAWLVRPRRELNGKAA